MGHALGGFLPEALVLGFQGLDVGQQGLDGKGLVHLYRAGGHLPKVACTVALLTISARLVVRVLVRETTTFLTCFGFGEDTPRAGCLSLGLVLDRVLRHLEIIPS